MNLTEAGIAVLWIGGSGYLYVQVQRYLHAKPHLTSDPEKIKALEEELRPWEPWSLDTEDLTTLPQRVEAKRVLFFGTPGPETREWLYRDDHSATRDTAYHTREEDER